MAYTRTFGELNGPLQPVCRHLRSKAIYVAGEIEPPADIEQMGSGHCWCNHTQHVLGPDSLTVNRNECNANRGCYDGVL